LRHTNTEVDFHGIWHWDIQQELTGHFYVGLFWRSITPALIMTFEFLTPVKMTMLLFYGL
jgi:hypothetical protein